MVVFGGKATQVSNNLAASIKSISRTGEVQIQFASLVFNYANVSGVINSTALKVVAGPKELSSAQTSVTGQTLNLTWNAVDYP